MNTSHKAVYFFCCDPTKDPVAHRVFDALRRIVSLVESDIELDGYAVLASEDANSNIFHYVRTHEVLSHDYAYYLPIIREHFTEFDFAGIVNWHEGQKAPEAILTVHTTGDVVSGHFGPAHPMYLRNLLLALEDNRKRVGLDHFTTTTEATHWSGIPSGGSPALIVGYPVPLVDIEIGSSPKSWSNPAAAEAIARSLSQVFDGNAVSVRSLLCVGGIHFEPAFAHAIFHPEADRSLAVSHILSNQWVIAGAYNTECGPAKLKACIQSIQGGIDGIAFHDNLGGAYKAQLRLLGERLGLPVFKHQMLRRLQDLPLW